MESVGQHLDELSEVDTCVGNVIENGFVAVALVFDVANFHLQFQFLGNLSRANHRLVFATFRFLEFFEVGLSGLTVDASNFGARF